MKTSARIPSLDGLRAISILLVVAGHFGNDSGWDFRTNFALVGVRVFFVISGFLITGILVREQERDGTISLPRFYLRRTLRIFPAFYFYLGVMLVLGWLGWYPLTFKTALPALTYTSNYWAPDVNASGYTITHTWSLASEEQFYLLWPALLMLAGRRRGVWIPAAVVVLSPAVRALLYFGSGRHIAGLDAFHLNADHLATGCLLMFLREPLHRLPVYRRFLDSRWMVLLLPGLIGAASLIGPEHPGAQYSMLISFMNLSIALCIDWAVTNTQSLPARLLNTRPMAAIGVLSYSIYLWQQPFLHLRNQGVPVLLLAGPWKTLAPHLLGLPRWHYRHSAKAFAAWAGRSLFPPARPDLKFADELTLIQFAGLFYGRHFFRRNAGS